MMFFPPRGEGFGGRGEEVLVSLGQRGGSSGQFGSEGRSGWIMRA
jgi:hypothetical protein